jgi:hypothetical protein
VQFSLAVSVLLILRVLVDLSRLDFALKVVEFLNGQTIEKFDSALKLESDL